jgi:phage gp29-like protein
VTELRRLAAERDEQGITPAHRIAAELIRLAEAGDLRAIREVMDRLDGAPARAVVDIEPQRIELKPITLERRD